MGIRIEMPDGTTLTVENGSLVEEVDKAVWSQAAQNDLPDSSFLHVEAGGKKDADGKTVPRSLRHFPVKDAAGKVDLPHVRNALARIPQSKLPQAVKDKCKAKAERLLAAASKSDFCATGRLLLKADEPAETKKHYVLNVVLEPCAAEATKDTQGDYYTAEDIWEARRTFMQKQGVGLFHDNPDTKGFLLLDNWITPFDFNPADVGLSGDPVVKGTWLIGMEIDEELNPKAWAGVQKGEYTAFSIEGSGKREPVKPEPESTTP